MHANVYSEASHYNVLVWVAVSCTFSLKEFIWRYLLVSLHMHVVLLQISVEEVAEPIEFPVSDVILLESHKAKKPGPGSRANKEMPDWVNKLAEKYDMTVHSDKSSPPI